MQHDRMTGKTLSRRRFTQGVAASPLALGALGGLKLGHVGAQDQTTVKYWTHTHPPMVEQNEAMIAEFEAANPDIAIEYEVIPNMEFGTKMLTSMGTGTGPDIINMDDNAMRSIYIPRGLVQEVDPVAMGFESLEDLQAKYLPGALEGASLDGKVYGVPSEFNVTAFIINTAAFEEAGLDPAAPPTTWEEVGEMAQQLVVMDGDTMTRRGFDLLYLHQGWYHNLLGTLLLQTGGRVVADDGVTVTVAEPEAVAALQIWYDMIYQYEVADPNIASREATVPYQDFLDGKVAMTMFNPWGMGFLTEETAVGDNWAIVPMPQVNPDAPVNPLYAYYWSINSLTTDEAVKNSAGTFVSHLSSAPGQWLQNVDFIQPVVGWASMPEAENFKFGEVWESEMAKGQFLPLTPQAEEVDNIMMQAIELSLLTGVEPQEALDGAKAQIEAALAS
ncbi:MAG: extracellular solute-binding protein [Thermomicrobiales bacterium]|nr:extracellular solute-binding protein [Thermomicrobiales bacterium]MCO5222824.1 extracellular solute-binding protein [Thermomicrobiales bacterium]